MPELPEVETFARKLRKRLCGLRIQQFRAFWPRQVSPSVVKVRRAIVGRRITRLARRGKYLVFHLDDHRFLLVHLGMSGRLEWAKETGEQPAHIRALWELEGRRKLLFCDPRKFGRIQHVETLDSLLVKLGPEPLRHGFTVGGLASKLQSRSRRLKTLLLDQSVVAGLGNIYADEALFRAGIHPLARSDQINAEQIKRLHRAIREVLRQAIRLCGTSFDWAYSGGRMQSRLRVYGRAGLPCPRCGTVVSRIRINQRSCYFCPACQR